MDRCALFYFAFSPCNGICGESIDFKLCTDFFDCFLCCLDLYCSFNLLIDIVSNYNSLITADMGDLNGIRINCLRINTFECFLLGSHFDRNSSIRLNFFAFTVLKVDIKSENAVIGLLVFSKSLFCLLKCFFILFVGFVELLDNEFHFFAESICRCSYLYSNCLQIFLEYKWLLVFRFGFSLRFNLFVCRFCYFLGRLLFSRRCYFLGFSLLRLNLVRCLFLRLFSLRCFNILSRLFSFDLLLHLYLVFITINCICDHACWHIRDDHRQRQQQSQSPSL